MMKRAGCAMLMPSRSTVFTPLAALSSTTSTRPSSSRFTSSTYRMPRFAFACATAALRLCSLRALVVMSHMLRAATL